MKKLLLIVLLFVAGCAPWIQVGGLYRVDSHKFSVELPQGWMRSNTTDHLLITRDGVLLQNIFIGTHHIDKPLEHTKKKLKEGMLPQEVAEVVLDNTSSNPAILKLEVMENTPIKISGFSGFRIVCTYKNKDGLRFKSIYCGFMAGEWLYGIRYVAAARYYFDKDLKIFEKVLESFKLIKTV